MSRIEQAYAATDQCLYHVPCPHCGELQALDVRGRPPAARELAIIAKGDEVLDWREMVARYPLAELRLLEGGDHALSNFTEHLEPITRFLQLA